MPFKDPERKRAWRREYRERFPEKIKKWRNDAKSKRRSPIRRGNCELCGIEFEARRKEKRFCSRAHQRAANAKRYRAKHPDKVAVWQREGSRRYRAKHSKRLNRLRWERAKRRRVTDPERVLAQRREYRRRYRETHRERVRRVNRDKKRREDARLKALTVDQIVQLIKRRGEHVWPQRLLNQLLIKVRKAARGDHEADS